MRQGFSELSRRRRDVADRRGPAARICLSSLLIFQLLAGPVAAGDDEETAGLPATAPVAEPDGYRTENYRAPTPAGIAGGSTVTTDQLRALIGTGDVVLIDVLPAQQRPENLPATTLWIPQPRMNIPGSIWLPDVGRGAISAETDAYFRGNLERLTNGDLGRNVVIYCLADCWMSWNAAKRAISYGYTNVHWYPAGTNGWTAAGLPTQSSEPVPMPGP